MRLLRCSRAVASASARACYGSAFGCFGVGVRLLWRPHVVASAPRADATAFTRGCLGGHAGYHQTLMFIKLDT